MSHTDISGLVRDLVLWVGRQPRTYDETMDAWRTSCPRLTVWEEAVEQGLVRCVPRPDGTLGVEVTERGNSLYSLR
jgi:hypothetical protein